MRRYGDIIERIEIIRTNSGLNKSRFASAIGLKPQTYNNFVGAQGSKPSIDLIHGVVRQFQVDPNWLLVGTGPMYLQERRSPVRNSKDSGSPISATAGDSVRRPAKVGELELVRDVISALEELQTLLDRLQGHLSIRSDRTSSRAIN